jgi:hypothetical protein
LPLIEEHGVERLDRLPGKRPEVGVGVGRPLPRASSTIRARARPSNTFVNAARVVAMRCSMNVPSSVRMQI